MGLGLVKSFSIFNLEEKKKKEKEEGKKLQIIANMSLRETLRL